ncbi:MAG: tungstate ABC transporter substrate-binding protein WtpA [Desulfatirhabdiaceae bacterium]
MNQFRVCHPATMSIIFAIILLSIQPVFSEPQGKLILFHAGSLSMPFDAMEKAFEKDYPKVDLIRESGGSQQVARKVTEQKKPCDIVASADYKVIDKMLIPDFADWNILFASNQLVLCFTDKSKYANQITAGNWYEIIQKKDVSWGHSDPNLDPCGYRALMVIQLAEKYYQKPGLNEAILANRPPEHVRPKAEELVSMLQNGTMDYAWEYLSVAVQHGLKFVALPDEVNLGNYAHDAFYSQAVVKVTGKDPGTFMDIKGDSCTYGLTMINNAPNPEAAVAFLKFMLSPNGGLKILKDQGQPPFIPCLVPSAQMKSKLPAELKPLVQVKN